MTPINTILAATDFSPAASHAEERAALLAAQHNARLILLYCLPGTGLERLRDYLRLDAAGAEARLRNYYEGVLRRQAEVLGGQWQIDVTPMLVIGQPHREISKSAQKIGADLVVLGATGEHPVREFFLGATAERVIREAAVPVLVVKNAPAGIYQRVLAALDLSPHSPAVLTLAHDISPQAHLTLGHAFEVPFESKLQFAGVSAEDIGRLRQEERERAMAALNSLADTLENRPGIHMEHGMAYAILPQLLQETAAELAVTGKHGRSEIVDLLLGSVTKHLLLESKCDVLVVPPMLKTQT